MAKPVIPFAAKRSRAGAGARHPLVALAMISVAAEQISKAIVQREK
jgi:hypothetical protein